METHSGACFLKLQTDLPATNAPLNVPKHKEKKRQKKTHTMAPLTYIEVSKKRPTTLNISIEGQTPSTQSQIS